MGHDLTIYDRSGERKFNLLSRAAVCGVSRASQKTNLLADDTITISAESARPLNITIGDNIRIFGKRYTFNQLPQPTKNGERSYSYELTLEGLQYDLIDVHYHLPADAYGETYYANLQRHLEVLEWNINRIHPGWTVQVDADAYDPDNYQNITTSEKNALAMLQDLCSLFGVEFEITAQGNAGKVHVKKKAGTTHLFTLRYGRGKGLYKLSRTNVNNAGITNRLYVYGSQENLPQNYCHTKLCLADTTRLTSYLEDADSIAAYGVKEGEKNYPDIKAERVGVITAVGDNRITFFDTSGDASDPTNLPMFDLNEKKADGSTKYLIDGTSAKIKFQTGNLAGYEFDLHSYDHATNKFVINRFTDENGLVIPNDTQDAFTFAVGDKYIITDIMLPDSYVQQAQARLKAKALADFPPMTQPQVSYKVGLTEGFFTAKFGKEVETELLHVGDFIHIIDEEIGVDKEIRITAITRDLLRLHSYELTLSDTVVKSSTVKIINEIKDLQDVISFNSGFADPGKARRRWMATQELLNLVFDPEGDYYSEKIKPLSIETQMLSVGAKSTQFTLQDVVIQPNFNGNPNAISFSAGRLVHYGIDPENTRPWVMGATVFGGLPPQAPLYIYAVCPRNGGNGVWQLSTTPIACEAQAAVYFFLVGVLNSVSNDEHGGNPARLISLTYGSSTINGRFVRCGRIESSGGGATYFDLDTGVISGRILFKSNDGTVKDVSALEDRTKELEDYVNNVLPGTFEGINTQIDGKIETFFQEADPAAGWDAATYPAHVGDLWFNTATKELKRFSQAYNWERIEDADAIAAAEAASRAQDTADGKRRIFVATPTTPYDKGDMWAQGATGDLMRCIQSRATGAFQETDWDKASKYTGDENLNDFIENTYNVAMAEIANQLDGVIETHFGSGVPTLTNAPAVEWTTTQSKETHLGDLYYNNDTGIGYRFSKDSSTYKWVEVRDSGVTEALAAAAAAQDTADGKRRVFIAQPVPPYDVGDLWANGTFLKRCIKSRTAGTYDAGDWDLATNYTGDESLNEFIDGVFGDTVSDIYNQLDGKLESYYGTTDPATEWKTAAEKEKHVGDQWYNTTTKELKRYSKRPTVPPLFQWVKIENADAIAAAEKASQAQDTADGKRRVFVAQPYPPYDQGDLWAQGTTGDILVCVTSKQTGNFAASDWTNASKYTDDSALTDFILNQYADDMADLLNQIDGKIECFYTNTNPADNWAADNYDRHVGDQWYNVSTKNLYRFIKATWFNTASGWIKPIITSSAVGIIDANHATYYWLKIENADAIAAAAAAAAAQDTADGKRTVFVTEPKAPYYVGDLWLKGIDSTGKAADGLWRCIKDNTVTNSFDSNDWVEATYYDCTQVVIDNGIITAGTVQLANEHTGSIVAGITGGYGKTFKETASTPEEEKVRIWAGASENNRRKAPFRVLQNGKVYAKNAEIEGKVTATDGTFTGTVNANAGRIGRLVIMGNDLAGLDDNGVERVRIGVGSLPSVNTAFSRVGISFSLSSSDGEASWPEDAGGYYTANVIGSGREISTNRDDGNYTDNAHVSAVVRFSLSQTARTVTFGRWDAGYRTSNASAGTVTAKGTATLYRVVGTTRTKIGSWEIEEQSYDVDFDSLSPGNYEVHVTTYVEFSGEYWFGDVEFWIGGGIWIETAAQSTNITTIAKDGILTMHASDKYLFYSASQGFETRWGNYGLKVDSSGAQTLVNGKWVRIKTT